MRIIWSFLLAALFAMAGFLARASDTTRVLFIGNSFTGVNDLPEVFRLFAASTPGADVVMKQSNTPGGYLLSNHATNAQTLALIDAGGWDYVVLQEQSLAPAFPESQFQQDVVPYAKMLSQRIRQHNPCARIVFYNTWGYKNGDAQNCAFFAPLCTYQGMDSMLRLRYHRLSDSNDAIHGPVGPVWRRIRANALAIELYDADERHPSAAGTYAAACALYAVIFGKDPQPASYNGGLPPQNATFIRLYAKEVAFDSLAYWRQFSAPLPAPTASFSRSVSGLSVQFTSTSTGAVSCRWNFGNGATSTIQSPSYTYPFAGTYSVKLVVKTACGVADSVTQNVTVSTTSIAQISPLAGATLKPNPASETIWLNGLPTGTQVIISDLTGRSLLRATTEPSGIISLASLSPGMYWVYAQADGWSRVWPLVRR